jgi:hypothetical protein
MPAVDTKITRIKDENDPNRCEMVHNKGQCVYVKIPGQRFCPQHGTNTVAASERRAHRNYNLARIQGDVDKKLDSSELKSLREEICILRVMLERQLNGIADDYDLIANSAKISDLICKIQGLVTACHKIEVQSGFLMDKNAILQITALILNVITNRVTDPDVIDILSDEIPNAIVSGVLDGPSVSAVDG